MLHERTLRVTEEAPEQVVLLNYTDLVVPTQGSMTEYVDEITVRPARYSRPGRDDAREATFLEASLEEDVGLDVQSASGQPILQVLPASSPTDQNPAQLRWETTWEAVCPSPPAYQVQVLRLFNTNPAWDRDEMRVRAAVDWERALTVEVEEGEELDLTLAEGTGYYVWRVRPIGSFYSGGIADARNWGTWSEAPVQGETVELTSPTGVPRYAFFYRQFDDDKNWVYTRSFAEDGRIDESITYANGLLQVVQEQARLASKEDVLASQTVQDFAGRPALRSLAAPLGRPHLAYEEQLLTRQGGALYTAEAFDRLQAQNFLVPEPESVLNGPVADYYSDQNADLRIPSAEGYPFTRTRYLGDGTGRVVEASGVGATHRIGAGHTARTYYSAVADGELVRVFGDEAPRADAAEKITVFDPNGTATVRYLDRGGTSARHGPRHYRPDAPALG